ncbi:MAG TPA: phage terminase large subunit [Novosphingobium sp.]|nr:phage terminase large subunit [Novosphingobium sp.]
MIHQDMLLQIAKTDFHTFCGVMLPYADPGGTFDDNWHIEAMAHEVTQLIGGSNRRLLVTMPPRCLKSYIMSVALPAFLLGQNPAERIVVVTYGEQLAEELSEASLRIMSSKPYQRMFPATVLTTRTKRTLKTSAGGKRFSTTIGGAMTGMGGGWLIVDDPLNAPNAYSEALREQSNAFFDKTLSTRGDKPKTTRFIVVMQRLHEEDLAGHILRQGGWRHLKLQAKATEDALIDIGGGRQHKVTSGELLHEERLDDQVLAERLAQMGSGGVEAQYQQNPLPVTGNQIKFEWLQRYASPVDRGDGIVVQSWDTASKIGVANDWSVCTTWLLKDKISYLLHVWRGRLEFPALRDQLIKLYNEHGASRVLIENASSGMALIQDLRGSTPFNVVPRDSRLDKRARVDGISGALESGRVLFPTDASWLPEFEREILSFPAGRHNDQVDSMTQYVWWSMEYLSGSGFEYDFGCEYVVDTGTVVDTILSGPRFW